MKFKLDENIGRRGVELLEAAGHDVMTVREQDLGGAAEEELFKVCSAERRTLTTLDHGFGHILRFPPEKSAGIVEGAMATDMTPEDAAGKPPIARRLPLTRTFHGIGA